ncbi:MAG TPA: nucleoside triphosphate pyrophosphatase [Acetobacteraceae bacterium]|nr:nucleoside triphosphate pyrophosphatase [Acetobacteraceae bacterium]
MFETRPRLILASASPTRRALLEVAGVPVEIRPAAVDEESIKHAARAEDVAPEQTALLLADIKAKRIREPDALIIGADQLLVCEGTWFDKPADLAAAEAQLRALRGRTHTLHTAVVCVRDGTRIWQHVATPRLTMRDFSDAFLESYLRAEGEALLGSVGAYRIEGPGIQLFDAIEGEHSAILGLPLLPLLGFLRQHGALIS